jgi:hypothetical protein
MSRYYRIVIAENEAALKVAAGGWTILGTTIREYAGLDTGLTEAKAGVGAVDDLSPGWIALAYKEFP